MAQAIGVEHRIAFTQLVAPHLRHSTRAQVSSNGRRRPRRAAPRRRKGELLCWASDYFLSGEKDDDL